jgi:filamentous hemagglutinin
MQGRGIPPSAVEDTIAHGTAHPDKIKGRSVFYGEANDISVAVEDATGTVITAVHGELR